MALSLAIRGWGTAEGETECGGEVALVHEAAGECDVGYRAARFAQQGAGVGEAALTQVLAGCDTGTLAEHTCEVHRVHTRRTRDVGDPDVAAECVVEQLAGDGEPCWRAAKWSGWRACDFRQQRQRERFALQHIIDTMTTHGSETVRERMRTRRAERDGVWRHGTAIVTCRVDCGRVDRQREESARHCATTCLEPITMGCARWIVDQRWPCTHGCGTCRARDVETVEHEDKVSLVVRMPLDHPMRIDRQHRDFQPRRTQPAIDRTVEDAERQREVAAGFAHPAAWLGWAIWDGIGQCCTDTRQGVADGRTSLFAYPTTRDWTMQFRSLARLTITGATVLGGATARAQAPPPRSGDDLLGLWGAEPQLGPQVRGALLLDRDGRQWTMRIGGFEAHAMQDGDSATIALPGAQGTLRLWTTPERVDAYWIQPAGMDPAYAMPVPLRATGAKAWRGTVTPIDAQFPLYLVVSRMTDGSLHGVFRNPAQNWPGRVAYYIVARDGESVTFTHPKTGKLQWRQPYDSARRTITFDFDAPIVLSPRTSEQAVGLVPRSPSLPAYAYRPPASMRDGWTVRTASAVGVSQPALESIVRELHTVDPLNDTMPRVHSLLVARRGALVLEEYFRGYAQDLPHDLRSASKTITSIMVGAAQQHGAAISSLTTLAGSPITVGHLLSHSSGLACDDDDDASPGNEDTMQSQHRQNDWYAFFLALPKVDAPGTTYRYCSAGINITGMLLRHATKLWLPRLFETELARPLQFSTYGVNLMPTGDAYAGGGMHLLPRDFLKLGQLYLDEGVWHGTRLVSAAWVRESTAHRMDRADGSDDGLGWHRHVLAAGAHRFQTYEASGNGGQFLVVIPELQLTIVVTAGNYGQYDVWQKIRERLVPAVMSAAR